jgi:hypothetical protein
MLLEDMTRKGLTHHSGHFTPGFQYDHQRQHTIKPHGATCMHATFVLSTESRYLSSSLSLMSVMTYDRVRVGVSTIYMYSSF